MRQHKNVLVAVVNFATDFQTPDFQNQYNNFLAQALTEILSQVNVRVPLVILHGSQRISGTSQVFAQRIRPFVEKFLKQQTRKEQRVPQVIPLLGGDTTQGEIERFLRLYPVDIFQDFDEVWVAAAGFHARLKTAEWTKISKLQAKTVSVHVSLPLTSLIRKRLLTNSMDWYKLKSRR